MGNYQVKFNVRPTFTENGKLVNEKNILFTHEEANKSWHEYCVC